LVSVVLVFCWPLGNPWAPASIASGDFTREFFALHAFAVAELERGRLPLWNPYTFGGHPYLAELQTAFWYPPHIVLHGLLLALHRALTLGVLEWLLPLHLLLAAAGAFALGRWCSRSVAGGVLAGIAYAVGGYMTSYPLQQLPILEASAWLPWQAYCLLRLAEAVRCNERQRRWLALTALISGWAALAGHAQTLLYAATLLLPLSAVLIRNMWRTSAAPGPTARRFVLALAAAFALAGGIAAAQYLPSAELAALSVRTALPYVKAAGGFSPSDLKAILVPTGPITRSLTLGPVLLPLVLAGAVAGWKRGAGFWLFMLAVGWLLSLGGHGFLYPLFHQLVPGYALFRDQERAVILSALSAAVLSAYGAAWFVGQDAPPMQSAVTGDLQVDRLHRQLQRVLAGASLVAVTVGISMSAWRLQQPLLLAQPFPTRDMLIVPYVVLIAAGVLLLACRFQEALLGPVPAGCLALLAWASVAPSGWGGNLRLGAQSPYAPPALLAAVRSDPWAGRLDSNGLVASDAGYVWRLPLINGMDELRPRALARLRTAVSPNRYWELLAVRWTLDWRPNRQASSHGWLVPAGASAGKHPIFLYAVPESRPIVTLVHQLWVLPRGADPYPLLASNDFAPQSHALLQGSSPPVAEPSTPDRLHLIDQQPGYLVVRYVSSAPGLLVYSELDYPGWQVQLDHRTVPLRRADTLLLATAAPAGRHLVEFVFRPAIVWWGVGITALAYAITGWLLWTSRGVRNRPRIEPAAAMPVAPDPA
jgi:hypothetical protein